MTGAMEGKTIGVTNQKLIDRLIASIVTYLGMKRNKSWTFFVTQ